MHAKFTSLSLLSLRHIIYVTCNEYHPYYLT